MKSEEIISVLKELHNVTGFRVSLHDEHFNELYAYPYEKLPLCKCIQESNSQFAICIECDKKYLRQAFETGKTVIYTCPHGLTEAVSPLYNFGILTGYLMMGQIINEKDYSEECDWFDKSYENGEYLKMLYGKTPIVKDETINSYVKIMTICAQYLTLSNAVYTNKRGVAQNAKSYIELNLQSKLTLEEICDRVCCSKSTLTSAFRREFGMSVNEFVTSARLKKAKELLATNKYSVGEVAELTGFYDQSYFAKVFTAKYDTTPSEYKKTGVL